MRLVVGYWPKEDRLVRVLLQLGEVFGREEGDALMSDLPFSRTDLASMVAVRPETLSRIIHSLEERGSFSFHGQTVTAALKKPAGIKASG